MSQYSFRPMAKMNSSRSVKKSFKNKKSSFIEQNNENANNYFITKFSHNKKHKNNTMIFENEITINKNERKPFNNRLIKKQ